AGAAAGAEPGLEHCPQGAVGPGAGGRPLRGRGRGGHQHRVQPHAGGVQAGRGRPGRLRGVHGRRAQLG
ncbi:unnamed protein product, partial [Heterosigma akashiwo]